MNCTNGRGALSCALVLIAAASVGFSPAALALGLGDVKVESYLNEPLKARIKLITQESDDLESVRVGLASAKDYEMIGASLESVSVPIRFTVEDIDGDAYILATSNQPVKDPVMRLIIDVSWSSGRMLREYTLFLDPATVSQPAPPPPRIDQRKSAPPPAPAPAAETPAAETTAAPAPAATTAAQPAVTVGGGEYGPVRSGETLWGIASAWARERNLGTNEVMIAIQRENPDAFLRNNINLLKRGAILRMPDIGEVEQISSATALQEVISQGEEFQTRQAALAASATTPLLAEESAAPEPSLAPAEPPGGAAASSAAEAEQPAAAEEAEAADATDQASPGDLLELVPPSVESDGGSAAGVESASGDTAGGAEGEDLRESLARSEEELINQKEQNEYLEDRIKELESELKTARKSTVADADMANMEDRLKVQRQVNARNAGSETPWYARGVVWLVGLLVVVAAGVGWMLSRRSRAAALEDAADESLRDIKSEAEDVLRVLSDDDTGTSKPEPAKESQGESAAPEKAEKPQRKARTADVSAEVLDEESSDPEIQLDLARAYISMGDKEAARVILNEVVSNGTEEQQAEATKMLDVLV